MRSHTVKIRNIRVGTGHPLVIIAGPCVIESEKGTLYHAQELVEITSRLGMPFVFKSSYDKANRTSGDSFRGPGLSKGLAILKKVKREFNIPVLSDVHSPAEARDAAAVLDVIQIPAFLSRQTDLISEVAKTKRPINIKKAQFMAPWDITQVIKKIEKMGNHDILLTERGTCFGYNNLVSDMRSLPIMKKAGYPVIYDATHSVQQPGGLGESSGGQREFVLALARAAVAVGTDGLFIETHRSPKEALSDGPNMVNLKEFTKMLKQVKRLREAVVGDV